jgi:roadblock/LC7 domain-containing protein
MSMPALSQDVGVSPTSFELCPGSRSGDLVEKTKSFLFPDDPIVESQWHLQEYPGVNWEKLIPYERYHRFGQGVKVAVVDDGISFHDDLDSSLFTPGYDAVADKSRNKKPGDINRVGKSKSIGGHGTIVAAAIAQTTCNGKGSAGIAPGVKLMPIRVRRTPDDPINISTVALGIEKAIEKGADVINISLDFNNLPAGAEQATLGKVTRGLSTRRLKAAIQKAYDQNIVVVMAAGNYSPDRPIPDYADDLLESNAVITVAAHTKDGRLASYSSQTQGVDITAPGGEMDGCRRQPVPAWLGRDTTGILVTAFKDNTLQGASCSGTSMAAPQVAAAAALIIAEFDHCPDWKKDTGTYSRDDNLRRTLDGFEGFNGSCYPHSVDDVRTILQHPEEILEDEHPGMYASILKDRYILSPSGKQIPRLDVYASDFAAYEFIFHGRKAVIATSPRSGENSVSLSPSMWLILIGSSLALVAVGVLVYAFRAKSDDKEASSRKGESNATSGDKAVPVDFESSSTYRYSKKD